MKPDVFFLGDVVVASGPLKFKTRPKNTFLVRPLVSYEFMVKKSSTLMKKAIIYYHR